jgi:acetyl esterase
MPVAELDGNTLAAARSISMSRFGELPPAALAPTERVIPGPAGAPDVGVMIYDPPGDDRARAAVIHVHGGGMVMGSVQMSLLSMPPVALAHNCVVISVDYRLAPEAPFPAPQEDNYAALAWVVANAAELGIDPKRIVVAGESAGGGLAAALALMARDRGQYQLAGQVLTYPMLDHRVGGPDDPHRNPTTGEFVWTRSRNQFGWSSLRGDYRLDDHRVGWFSPALASELKGLAPTFIATGALDLFFDENVEFARRTVAAGVDTELHVYPGAVHAFNVIPGTRLVQQYAADVQRAFARLFSQPVANSAH